MDKIIKKLFIFFIYSAMDPIILVVVLLLCVAVGYYVMYGNPFASTSTVVAATSSTTTPTSTDNPKTNTTTSQNPTKTASGALSTAGQTTVPPTTPPPATGSGGSAASPTPATAAKTAPVNDLVTKYVTGSGIAYTTKLPSNTVFNIGDALFSTNKQYVVYLAPTGSNSTGILTEANTNTGATTVVCPKPASILRMQSDGNLVLYIGSNPQTSSGTQNNPGAYLHLQSDGTLAVVQPDNVTVLWKNTMSGAWH